MHKETVKVHLRNVIVNALAAVYVLPVTLRIALMRLTGIAIGEGTTIKSRCTFAGPGPIIFGSGCYISFQCEFDATGTIEIADNVNIASGVSISTCTHRIGDLDRRAGPRYTDNVSIGKGTWVGTNCVILPGVRIGPGCVIAAGAVVAADCDANGLYAGVPAKLVNTLDPEPIPA
jgi:maltose O-acetyltransferase